MVVILIMVPNGCQYNCATDNYNNTIIYPKEVNTTTDWKANCDSNNGVSMNNNNSDDRLRPL